MAVYKVPQDVEAEDKLVGPFGFRQFVYLMIAGFCVFLAYLFFRIYPALALIPLPVIGFFVLIALPLRKDQPMEIYLLALLRFYLKPKRRLWNPDGTVTYVAITVPKAKDELPTKGLSQEAAEQRLDYLARVMDTRGWSIKGVASATTNSSVMPTVAAESFGVTDIMDDSSPSARSFDDLLAKKDEQNRQNAVNRMRQVQQQPPRPRFARNPYDDVLQRQFTEGQAADETPQSPPASDVNLPQYSPYPSAIHQKVINPNGPTPIAEQAPMPTLAESSVVQTVKPPKPTEDTQKPMAETVSPDIIRLASNTDLSISAIAHEAQRLQGDEDQEVFIKLR